MYIDTPLPNNRRDEGLVGNADVQTFMVTADSFVTSKHKD
jgi:hypothetical protein